jgi:hypothetical protein
MDGAPLFAEFPQILGQELRDFPEIRRREAKILPQVWRAVRAVQVKNCLMLGADYMNVRRPMIIGVDDHPEAINAQDRDHALAPLIT